MDYGDLDNAAAAWSMIRPITSIRRAAFLPLHETSPVASPALDGASPEPVNGAAAPLDVASRQRAASRRGDLTLSSLPARTRSRSSSKLPGAHDIIQARGPLSYSCDGRCGKSWTYSDDMYICCDCRDVQFDAGCLAKLRAGSLKPDACNPDHRFLHVPLWDQEQRDRIGGGNVVVSDNVISVDEWLARVRWDWGIRSGELAEAA
jgi:hypothetical protein